MKRRRAVLFLGIAIVLSILVRLPDIRYTFFDGVLQQIEITDFTEFTGNDCYVERDGTIVITGEDPWLWILGQEVFVGKIQVNFQNIPNPQTGTKFYWDTGNGFNDDESKKAKIQGKEGTLFVEKEIVRLRMDFEGTDKRIVPGSVVVNPAVGFWEKMNLLIQVCFLMLYFTALIFSTVLWWTRSGKKMNAMFGMEIVLYLSGGVTVAMGTMEGWKSVVSFLCIWLFGQFVTCVSVGISQRITTGFFFAGLFAMYVLWLGTIPFNGAPDEEMRYLIPQYIYRHGTLPVGNDPEIRNAAWGTSYGFTPTICYLLPAVLMKIGTGLGLAKEHLYLAARLASVVYSMAAAGMVRKIGKLLFDGPSVWVFTAVVMMLPQYLFISGYVNCDSFGMLGTSLLIWQVLEGKKKNFPVMSCIGIGAGVSVCLLSYYNTYGIILVMCIYCTVLVLGSKEEGKEKKFFISLAVVGLTAAILTGWWFVRNYRLYDGDFLGLRSSSLSMENFAKEALRPSVRISPAEQGMTVWQMMTGTQWWKMTLESFVGVFGRMDIWMAPGIYIAYFVAAAVCLAGNILPSRFQKRGGLNIAMMFAMAATTGISLYYSWCKDFQPQGRYILPVLIPLGMFLVFGYEKITECIAEKYQSWMAAGLLLMITAGSFAALYTANAAY